MSKIFLICLICSLPLAAVLFLIFQHFSKDLYWVLFGIVAVSVIIERFVRSRETSNTFFRYNGYFALTGGMAMFWLLIFVRLF